MCARGDKRAGRRAKGRKRMALENEKEVEKRRCSAMTVRGERESQMGESEGSRREELLYVTVVFAVRCGRSRRCLLIYWCDSFRRRAAFPKWCPRVRHGYLLTPRPRPHGELPFHLRLKERKRERGRDSCIPRSVCRSLIFISDRRSGVTPRIKSRVIDEGRRLVRYGTMTAAFVRWTAVVAIHPSSPWTLVALIRMIHGTRGDLRLGVNKVK